MIVPLTSNSTAVAGHRLPGAALSAPVRELVRASRAHKAADGVAVARGGDLYPQVVDDVGLDHVGGCAAA
jgi:hypothetical protein